MFKRNNSTSHCTLVSGWRSGDLIRAEKRADAATIADTFAADASLIEVGGPSMSQT